MTELLLYPHLQPSKKRVNVLHYIITRSSRLLSGTDEPNRGSHSYSRTDPRTGRVLPLTVVANSTFSPIRLTVHSDTHYDQEALSFSHFKRRGSYDLSSVPVLAHGMPPPLTGAALVSLLAPSSAFPLTSREQTHPAPPTDEKQPEGGLQRAD